MNCADVEPYLDQLAVASDARRIPEEAELRRHLADCSACQHELKRRERWDRQLSRAMGDISIPAGFKGRLAVALQGTSPKSTISAPVAASLSSRRAWIRTWSTAGAICVLVISLGWILHELRPATLSAANVSSLWETASVEMPSESTVKRQLPHGWSTLGDVFCQDWKQAELRSLGLAVAVKPFEIRSRRGLREEGWLFVIPKSRWTPGVVNSVSKARMQYAPDRAWIAWAEGKFVFVLATADSPQSLERLQRQLDHGHSVL